MYYKYFKLAGAWQKICPRSITINRSQKMSHFKKRKETPLVNTDMACHSLKQNHSKLICFCLEKYLEKLPESDPETAGLLQA